MWVLCSTRGVEDTWKLWHVDREREREMHEYSADSTIAAA